MNINEACTQIILEINDEIKKHREMGHESRINSLRLLSIARVNAFEQATRIVSKHLNPLIKEEFINDD